MSALESPHHELFCNCIARGHSAERCFIMMGLPSGAGSGETLLRFKSIKDRIAELVPLYKEKYEDIDAST